MKKSILVFGIAFTALGLFASVPTTGSPCADDHHGLRGICQKRVVNGVTYYVCNSPVDPTVTNCTYYVN
ncbi:hypothetical protein SAMN05444266_101276 [Chitinophaga jiangningensis]|uniref:Uncharacterized protein n=1 Tax=Chitinophaga jiangningensis TaxID=1419482 RepID=A0A1M6VMH1_9BACT|nr:hypothetical protein [Chitinophaga jiangningensis]SHK82698.1 hypothetical protein SAMN05444266_101276 [Chitinophaga jiangningensis]